MTTLRDSGVTDIVVSPGSRSTPFVAAAAHVGLHCHTIVDERAAGFFALGRAKVSGTPVALLCTSGSAGCHYFPAIVEASHSFTPLIAITADRPSELHGCDAPQAMNQTRLYGDHVRASIDLGAPHEGDLAMRSVQRKAIQAVTSALTPTPGPVHINAPARKPLEPSDDAEPVEGHSPTIHTPVSKVSDAGISELAGACASHRRGVIIAGPAPIDQRSLRERVAALSAATGYPVLAEATSQLRLVGRTETTTTCDGFAQLLSSTAFVDAHRADVVIQIGATPAGWELNRYVNSCDHAQRYVLAAHGWPDPTSSATALLFGDIGDALERLTGKLGNVKPDDDWAQAFRDGSELAWRCSETVLGEQRDQVGEDQIMRAVVGNAPNGCLLALANSLPVRTVDWFCPGTASDLDVTHQRGLNGIDGLIAGAAGAASARTGPTLLVLGDVSFAHDVGGLAAARSLETPLAIVVVDNRGGHIFDYLPIADRAELAAEYQAHWLAEQSLDICSVATSYGLAAVTVSSAGALSDALTAALSHNGCTVIHAPVAPTSAKQSKQRVTDDIDRQWPRVTS